MNSTNRQRTRGFSMVEAVVTIAVLAILIGGSVILVGNIRSGTKGAKLRKHVSTLNSAVKVYVANGGSLVGVTDPREVLRKLKTVTAGDDAKQLVGIKGSALDLRTLAVMQTPTEEGSGDQRVLWDTGSQRFVLANSGANGVREFVIDESAPITESSESRETNLKFAKDDNWVWDYQDRGPSTPGGPGNVPTPGTTPTPAPPPTPTTRQLAPPIIETPGQEYTLGDFPMSVPARNPNPPGASELMYSTIPGVWSAYSGEIEIMPGETLEVIAVSIDPDNWTDSDPDDETYTADVVTPELEVDLPATVNYVELGGDLVTGSYPTPTPLAPGTVSLLNGDEIPLHFEESSYFQVYWTYDGTDPVGASDREEGAAFSGTFVPQDIPITMSQWGTGDDELTVKVQAESFDKNVFSDSPVHEVNIGIEPIDLRPPLVETSGQTITFTQNPDLGDLPVGTRIYYTTDGTDPGVDADNNPVLGTLYEGPFEEWDDVDLVVRVYPPVDYLQWFTPSEMFAYQFQSPFMREVFIGGRFALPNGTFRNVAKLGEDGNVDYAFNPGIGASYGSTVGVIMPQNGGKILAGGDFDSMNTTYRMGAVRLNNDGSVDPGFDAALE